MGASWRPLIFGRSTGQPGRAAVSPPSTTSWVAVVGWAKRSVPTRWHAWMVGTLRFAHPTFAFQSIDALFLSTKKLKKILHRQNRR